MFAGFRGSAAIRKYFVRECLNATVNGHVYTQLKPIDDVMRNYNGDKSTTKLVAAPCNFIGYGSTLPQEERTDAQDRARDMADHFSDSLHRYSERIFSVTSFAGAANPFSNERRPHLLVDVKSSDTAIHSIR